MKTKTLLCITALCLTCLCAAAQQTLWPDTIPIDPPTPPELPPQPELLRIDTVTYAQGACLGTEFDDSDVFINFRLKNDTLYIDGTVVANCCGEHHLVFMLMPDSIYVQVMDEFYNSAPCDCVCLYEVHEKFGDCTGEEYKTHFKNAAAGGEKTIDLQAEPPTAVSATGANHAIHITQPERNVLCIVTTEGETFDLKIYSLSGQRLQTLQGKSGGRIDTSSLPAGLYMMVVNDTAIRKFIKQ